MRNFFKKVLKFVSSRLTYLIIGIFLAIGATYVYATWDSARTGGSGQLSEANWNELVTMIQNNIGAGGGLKVYKADGTTLLGYYGGFSNTASSIANCSGWALWDTTGVLHNMVSTDCTGYPPSIKLYYTGTGCTGSIYADRDTGAGVKTDGTIFVETDASSCLATNSTHSTRQNGVCTNENVDPPKGPCSGQACCATWTMRMKTAALPTWLCGYGNCVVK